MPLRLNSHDNDFAKRFDDFLRQRQVDAGRVDHNVKTIVDRVRTQGDQALFAYTEAFDGVRLTDLRLDCDQIKVAKDACDRDTLDALNLAFTRIERYHQRQKPSDDLYCDDQSITMGTRWRPVASAGLYVPGGTAAYPSSVLMNAIPARVAGVKRLAMVTPPGDHLNPLVLAAASICEIDEIYLVGGAQAIAALAFGTQTIDPVSTIVGPGNQYVAAAKKIVFGTVGIDMIAGPSEVLIVADKDSPAQWMAMDLLSQAEHDINAQAILITDNADFANKVERAIDDILPSLERHEIAAQSWQNRGVIIIVEDLDQAPALADAIAPEHLQIVCKDAEKLAENIHYAGALFLGPYSPEALGDYIAGPNHVLPTAASARFSSGLSVYDFMVRHSILAANRESFAAIAPSAAILADAEGLGAHARSLRLRLK